MGGRGSSSGISASGNSAFQKISIDGKTGTDKQKAYAENLLENARLTAKANGIAGYSKVEGSSIERYTPKEDAEAVKGAYKFISEAVNNRKTYGEVIDFLKNNDVLSLSKVLKAQASRSNMSIEKFVDEYIKRARKRK